MTARVEMLNAGINKTNLRITEVIVERDEMGNITVRRDDHGHADTIIPGQRFTGHAGETRGRAILIEEE